MSFRLLAAAVFLTFVACSDAPEAAVADAAAAPPTTTAPLDVVAAPVAQPDQIEATTEANPQIIDLEKMPPPKVTGATTGKVAPQKKPASKKETVVEKDATKVSKTTAIEQSPEPVPAQTKAPEPSTAPATAPPVTEPEIVTRNGQTPDHAVFDALLKKHVNGVGNVNYAGLKQDENKLDAYLAALSETAPESNWTRNERLAYWINAYNGFTLKLILDNYPVKSIRDINGGKPWDKKWIDIGGKTYSLNNLEHDIIRPRFKEPRIHFALVCAAASCPPLANRAFTAGNLIALLESRTKGFLNSEKYNTITADKAEVSSLFDWYAEDFGDVRTYLNKYAKTSLNEGAQITFRDYDWALNKQ